MLATYLDPSNSPKDAVRFWIGDTDMNAPLLSDGEVAYCLKSKGGSVLQAALFAISSVSAKLSTRPDETVGPVSVSNASVLANLAKQITLIRREIALSAIPWVGGISYCDKLNEARNPDVVRPAFTKQMLQPRTIEGDIDNASEDDTADGTDVAITEDV